MGDGDRIGVTVLTGGSTPERHVALAGARQVVASLRRSGYGVTVVDTCSGPLDQDREQELLVSAVGKTPPAESELAGLRRRESFSRLVDLDEVRRSDLLFLVLHGRQGEGGQLQAMLELCGIPFTGSGSLGSMLAMDKEVAKRLMTGAEVPTPAWELWPCGAPGIARLGFPLVVKPSRVGSTVGLSVVHSAEEVERAVEEAQRFDDEVLLERFVGGRELTVGVLDDRALAVGEIITGEGIFDYESKYQPGGAREVFPAEVDAATAAEAQRLAVVVHRALKLRDFSRVDFRFDQMGRLFCLEANTLPGMTSTSLLPQSAAAAGIDFDQLCRRIVELALHRAA